MRVKRWLDVVGSAALLITAVPVMLATAAAVAVKHGRPVLFTQNRPGLNGTVFELYKFRSMLPPNPNRAIVTDEQRLTEFGRLLRSTSLDELPSLFNVLKGDMSFVGPRPLLVEYLQHYSSEQARRHEVRPGITGLAQVSGRNLVSWEDRFALDVQYVDAMSLSLDLKILRKTVGAVFSRRGINAEGQATMGVFRGTPSVPGYKQTKNFVQGE